MHFSEQFLDSLHQHTICYLSIKSRIFQTKSVVLPVITKNMLSHTLYLIATRRNKNCNITKLQHVHNKSHYLTAINSSNKFEVFGFWPVVILDSFQFFFLEMHWHDLVVLWYIYISKVHTLGNSTIKNINRLKAITPRLVKEQQWYWSSFDLWTIRVQRYTSDRISGLGIRRLVALLLTHKNLSQRCQ